MVTRQKTTAIESLDVARRLRKKTKVVDIEGTIASMEAEQPKVSSFKDAEAILAQKGCNVIDLSRGEMMLEAAALGLINVLKALENPQYRLDFVNNFNEGLLHYAAKGNQEKMVHYLLLRGCDPNAVNKFLESPIFIAAEMGSK